MYIFLVQDLVNSQEKLGQNKLNIGPKSQPMSRNHKADTCYLQQANSVQKVFLNSFLDFPQITSAGLKKSG